MPGVDWARSFLSRNRCLSQRFCSNINTNRAKVDPDSIKTYFSNLKDIAEVNPECIVNYDETNLQDDPGKRKGIVKRGQKYFDRIVPHTKTAVSIMFAASASGVLLPAYVVYKSEHLYDTWMEGGPTGTRYNRSKSGWFDAFCFEDWFRNIIIPYFKKFDKAAVKILIGDNLSSHFSVEVLQKCAEHNILFKCLPPNSTHLCQPLDVSLYGPMKRYWREVLLKWKVSRSGNKAVMMKDVFPTLLLELLNKMKPTFNATISSGFRTCGIAPFNPQEVLRKLPTMPTGIPMEEDAEGNSSSATPVSTPRQTPTSGIDSISPTSISDCVLSLLSNLRYDKENLEGIKRKKRVRVEPGKSILASDIMANQSFRSGTVKKKKTKIVKAKRSNGAELDVDDRSTSEDLSTSQPLLEELPQQLESCSEIDEIPFVASGSWAVIRFYTKKKCVFYVGQIIELSPKLIGTEWDVSVKFLKKVSSTDESFQFIWPAVEDLSVVEMKDIIKLLPEPDLGRREEIIFESKHFSGLSVL